MLYHSSIFLRPMELAGGTYWKNYLEKNDGWSLALIKTIEIILYMIYTY